jgi:ribulose-phosphate 3-epimerase
MNVTPAILTESFLEAQQQIESVRYSSLIDAIHVDVIDGEFVDNVTITPLDLTVADFEPLKIDFHLMTNEPMDFVYECEGVKEYLPIRCIYGQVERMSFQSEFLSAVKANEWKAGLALDLFTPLEAIEEDVWRQLDHVLLMSVEAGYQGQNLGRQALEKIRAIRQIYPSSERMHITVDGGIKITNAGSVLDAGADELCVGSAIWKSSDPVRTIEELYQLR